MAENSGISFGQLKITVDKDSRLRNLKEKQNEERHKKLEEIKTQALAAQRFKEQKEQERRHRLEEMRVKEESKRSQVEERKRAIHDAERDRLESILRRNQQRDVKLESKKRNDRSSMIFAFGSSTPRNLDPHDVSSSYWGHRRATSTQNITTCASATSLTRRQSERELDNGSKKRATSAGGLERSGEGSIPTTPAGCASGYLGRRRTDLMPTVPHREGSYTSSRKSLSQSPASSRPSSSLSQQSTTSVTSSVSMRHRPSSGPRRPRPISIAVTGVTYDNRQLHLDAKKSESKPPLPKARKSTTKNMEKVTKNKTFTDTTITTKPPSVPVTNSNQIDQNKINKVVQDIEKKPPEKPDEDLIQIETESLNSQKPEQNPLIEITEVEEVREHRNASADLLIHEIAHSSQTAVQASTEINEIPHELPVSDILIPVLVNQKEDNQETLVDLTDRTNGTIKVEPTDMSNGKIFVDTIDISNGMALLDVTDKSNENNENTLSESMIENSDMSSSMTKSRITTEEEAKAALAERRRLAREEAEKRAEQERLRIEREAQEELEKQRYEEEQVRLLIEAQRIAEQQRLSEAIREAEKKEEEEKLRRDEEQRLRALKEEADRKAREEAEKQKVEQQERLKNEEKEREARRKRVEAIMLRTRGKNNSNSLQQQNSEDADENKSENKVNGTKSINQEHPTTNGKNEIVDNIIPDESLKNANTVSIDTDSINSNNSWQTTAQFGNVVCNNNS